MLVCHSFRIRMARQSVTGSYPAAFGTNSDQKITD